MSSTNRHGLQRHENDFYETPAWAVDLVLDALGIGPDFEGYVIDCGAGTGSIANRVVEVTPKADVRGIEKDPNLVAKALVTRAPTVAWEVADWLTWQADGVPDLIIANPPYGPKSDRHLAEKFIRKAFAVSGKKTTICMLLRATYLIPKTRRLLRKEFGKPDRLELERRPSFNGSGCDSCDYAWHVWSPKRSGKWTVLELP